MLAQRPAKLFLIMVLIVGLYPLVGWAKGPVLLTDEDMDGIYARGIWVNFDINITLPGGNTLSVPSINIPDISKPGNVGAVPGGIRSVTATKQSADPGNSGSSVYHNTPGSGILVTDNAMQGNSGLIINAPNSAVSMSISVVVLNNSTVTGDILQSSNSYPTNLFLSLKSYMH